MADSVQRHYPVIPEVGRAVSAEFRTLRNMIYDLQDVASKPPGARVVIPQTVSSATPTSSSSSGPTFVTNNVTTAAGTNPNVTQLIGILAQAQRSFIPEYSTLPGLQDPASQNGSLVSVNGILYRFDGSTQPGQWKPQTALGAVIIDTHANRVANYPPATTPIGALFYESNTTLLLVNDGTQWLTAAGEIRDTHANRLSNWPSVQFGPFTPYLETDRTVIYQVEDASGTVNTSGTAVTWATGNHFINTGSGFNAAQWPSGTPITINGTPFHISVVNSATSLTLTSSAGTHSGVSYSVANGRWVYESGTDIDILTNLPADLGENDYVNDNVGFLFYATTHIRVFQWTANGAAPASASPGWKREAQEDATGIIQILPFGPGQFTNAWSICTGGTVTITRDDASTTSITKPDFSGAVPVGGTYSPTQVPASTVTLSGTTDDTSLSATEGSGTIDGGGVGSPQSVPDGSITITPDPHSHGLSSATVNLNGIPVANVVVPFYIRR
jgi:hypothetical protein